MVTSLPALGGFIKIRSTSFLVIDVANTRGGSVIAVLNGSVVADLSPEDLPSEYRTAEGRVLRFAGLWASKPRPDAFQKFWLVEYSPAPPRPARRKPVRTDVDAIVDATFGRQRLWPDD